ncbi:MAG: ABC transporter ATP-binding protein, partial [Cyanobacteriota bacterium SKYGB_h_bin112]|nr:ABC transporter ATP-binding protein [Cyanobacteriota bacterium SKYGB_h_bin112]
LCNLIKPDSGTVLINGQPVSDRTKPWIGVAPQENLLYPALTCAENLNFFAQLYGLSRRQRRHRVQSCLAAVGLADRHACCPNILSGGMKRRLSMAIALVHEPKLLILDEPTTGLDIEARYEIWDLIRTLKNQGITILLTTHLLDEAERLCQRIGILKQGCIIAEGTLTELVRVIPAQEIVIVRTDDELGAIACARRHGFTPRRYDNDLAFWLPYHLELKDIIACFEGVPLDSIARQSIRLEHIYLEVTQNDHQQRLSSNSLPLVAVENQRNSVENPAEKNGRKG